MKIGVIGRGFVGGSIDKFINEQHGYSTLSYDVRDDRDMNKTYDRIVRECDFIYVCVPTPMDAEGKCFTGIVRSALRLLSYYAAERRKQTVVLIKSTMVPNTSVELQKEFKNLIILTNPEFLTERTAYEDLCNSQYHVIGIPDFIPANVYITLRQFHKDLWPNSTINYMSNTEAEMVKYMTNSFYSYKVTFANHMYQLCQSMGLDYDTFINAAIQSDPRLGELHWQVPGPDGELGFGGKCFPKDFNGMIKLFERNGVDCDILKSVWDYNVKIRADQDWKRIEGATCQEQDQ
jgi:UDPglucose 6-dehydrogenase